MKVPCVQFQFPLSRNRKLWRSQRGTPPGADPTGLDCSAARQPAGSALYIDGALRTGCFLHHAVIASTKCTTQVCRIQKTSLTHRILLGGECSAYTFNIRSWIETVSGPSHAVLERRTEQKRRSPVGQGAILSGSRVTGIGGEIEIGWATSQHNIMICS
jgi:hypothetical protein